jgi:hypothetical protein
MFLSLRGFDVGLKDAATLQKFFSNFIRNQGFIGKKNARY